MSHGFWKCRAKEAAEAAEEVWEAYGSATKVASGIKNKVLYGTAKTVLFQNNAEREFFSSL